MLKVKNKSKEKSKDIFDFILVLMTILASGTPISSLYYSTLTIVYIFIATFILICKIVKSKSEITKINKGVVIFLIWLIVILLTSMGINGDSKISHYIGLIVTLLTALLVIMIMTYEKFKDTFIDIIVVICVYSILITLYANINKSFPASLPIISNETNSWYTFHYIYFFWGYNQWLTLIRNAAIFREPGVFASYTSLALMMHIGQIESVDHHQTLSTKKYINITIILISGIITSFSTTGIFCAVICILIYMRNTSKLNSKRAFFITAIVVATFVYFLMNYSSVFFSKFSASSNSYISLTDRTSGLSYAISSFLKDPIVGIGYTDYNLGVIGTSANAFADIAAKYGGLFSILVIGGLFRAIGLLSNSKKVQALEFIIICIILFSQALILQPIFLVFIMYGLTMKKSKEFYF